MARLSPLGMTKDSDERFTLRDARDTWYLAAMSRNMRPEPIVGDRVRRSGAIPSRAQQNAAVTALPPNETA